MRNLSELLALHNDLEEMFFAHQVKLLHYRFDEALVLLEQYEQALLTHIRDENEHLLPIYAARGTIAKGGAVQMFLDEHEKLKNHLVLFKDEIAKLAREDEPERKLLWLLEREAFFKKLCDHHDIRETNFLYPELDRITSDAEKLELLSRLTCRFGSSKAA
jgi:hemerythrin-like domain-containing protein